ncbi:MAG: glucose-1-phosphate thymidylyltransferase, partial [Solirubrobacterales bacterium]
VVGPAVIGPGCLIEDSSIASYSSIGPSVTVRDSAISDSIILEGCRLEGVRPGLESSLVGRNVEVKGNTGASGTLRVMLGDNSRVELS